LSNMECIKRVLALSKGAVLMVFDEPVRSVKQASSVSGVSESDIVKTVVVRGARGDYAVVVLGSCRVSLEKLGLALKDESLRLARAREVLEVTGYESGGVPPVCLDERVRTVIDKRVLERDYVVGGGGSTHALLKLPVSLLLQFNSNPIVADVSEC